MAGQFSLSFLSACGLLLILCFQLDVVTSQPLNLFKEENFIAAEDELGDFYLEVPNERIKREAVFLPDDPSGEGDVTTKAPAPVITLSSSIRPPTTPSDDDEDGDGGSAYSGSGTLPPPASFLRFQFVLIDYAYAESLADRESAAFRQLEDYIASQVESLYEDVAGYQYAKVLQFTESEYGVRVYLDIGSDDNYNQEALTAVVVNAVKSGKVNGFRVLPGDVTVELVSNACERVACPEDFTCVANFGGYQCLPMTEEPTLPPPIICRGDSDFPCQDNSRCISENMVCNGVEECQDGADERDCPDIPPPGPCPRGQAKCRTNNECILREYLCDGDYDCTDGSDEDNCPPIPDCEPNEVQCDNRNCVQKIWLCDGDDDCGDNSDESNCPTKSPGERGCSPSEFECYSRDQCVLKAFQCDNDYDCIDRSDEYRCQSPNVTIAPFTPITVTRGETVTIRCVAVGTPIPLISWRLNWGPVPPPPRVSSTSEGGVGVLTIRNAQESDSGAYTCEAMNNLGYIFAIPDAIVIVIPPKGICQAPYFNSDADTPSECLYCYCFDRSRTCESSALYKTKVSLTFNQLRNLKGVSLVSRRVPSGDVEYHGSNRLSVDLDLTELIIYDFFRDFTSANYYWALPELFLGNQLSSYGGTLSYTVRYNPTSFSQQTDLHDLVLMSGDTTLVYSNPGFPRPEAPNTYVVKMTEENWYREIQSSGRGDVSMSVILRDINREEFMNALRDIDQFFIRASYYNSQRETALSNVYLEVGGEEPTEAGRAFMVEDCQCPEEYGGLSCESCAAGYMNDGRGGCVPCECNGYSNDCDPETGVCRNCQVFTTGDYCESCEEGYYGNPTQGVRCDPCPCPYITSPSQHSPTCYLDTDGQVTCDSCAPGYTGRDCGECEENFMGNPRQFGSLCLPVNNRCDTAGTASTDQGRCSCKRNAQGENCDQCVEETFYLSEENQHGCISCFCMGVSRECGSTTYFRSQIQSQFTSDTQGFSLTDRMRSFNIESDLLVNPSTAELSFQSFQDVGISESFYWNLPGKFLGDKVSSYGGTLRYTIRIMNAPRASSMNNEPDVELRGNGVTLLYRHREQPQEDSGRSYTVPILEQYWTRMDGFQSTREFLLMALADLDYIIIRASYSSRPDLTVLQDVSLDIAEARDTGLARAHAVEQCVCPLGYTGLSCEDCDINFTRAGGGLYLGLCEECLCNGHSDLCDPESGVCQDCQHNTQGPFCDECQDGYYGNALIGTSQDCEPCPCPLTTSSNQFSRTCYYDPRAGPVCDACGPEYTGQNCERCAEGYSGDPTIPGGRCTLAPSRCDSRGTYRDDGRSCQCKDFVDGAFCQFCASGYYNLDQDNPSGCTACFCSAVTSDCSSSDYFRDSIHLDIETRDDSHNVVIRNRQNTVRVDDSFYVNPNVNEIAFNRFNSLDANQNYFWELPPRFRGDKVTSYGGYLSYSIYYRNADGGRSIVDADVEISGNDIIMLHRFDERFEQGRMKNVQLQLVEDNFQRADGQPMTREHFLMALSDVEYILIRVSYNQEMSEIRLRDVSLDIAVPERTNNSQAFLVEECACPAGYKGTSCQDCDFGYTRSGGGLYLGLCVPCECNGHSNTCDPETGVCRYCEDNTEGEFCQYCASGYYGDATSGSRSDCRRCQCPLTISSNQFAETCILDRSTGRGICQNCAEGYAGPDCGRCAAGYGGNPRTPGGTCVLNQASEKRPGIPSDLYSEVFFDRIVVRWSPPKNVQDIPIDGYVFDYGIDTPGQYTERLGPGTLSFVVVDIEVETTYIFRVKAFNLAGDGDWLTTTVFTRGVPVNPEVTVTPPALSSKVGTTVTIYCNVDGEYDRAEWVRADGQPLPRDRAFHQSDNSLLINDLMLSDNGVYVCQVYHAGEIMRGECELTVTGTAVSIVIEEPKNVRVVVGEDITLVCRGSSEVAYVIAWSKQGGGLPARANDFMGILTITDAVPSDSGTYICSVSNMFDIITDYATIEVSYINQPPTNVVISPRFLRLTEGDRAEFRCVADGAPQPTYRWSRGRSELSEEATVVDGVLVIPSVTRSDEDEYFCEAANSGGTSSIRTILYVLASNKPSVTVSPPYIEIEEGLQASFYCGATGDPTPSRTWSKVGGSLSSRAVTDSGRLTFYRADLADGGDYECRAINNLGVDSEIVRLVVNREAGVAPVVYLSERNVTISQGSTLTLICNATGIPQPTVTWSRGGGRPLGPNMQERNGVLRIVDVQLEDRDVYTCTAQNVVGSGSVSVLVDVERREPPLAEVYPIPNQAFTSGSDVQIQCRYTAGYPAPVITWSRAGGEPFSGSTMVEDGVLRILDITSEEQGTYLCTASNPAGAVQISIQVLVSGLPQITISPDINPYQREVGESAVLECLSTGDPLPSVKWMKRDDTGLVLMDSLDFTTARAVYYIAKLSVEDSGRYVCVAENAAGAVEKSIVINVAEKGTPVEQPEIYIDVLEQTVIEGESARFTCTLPGAPVGTYSVTWGRVGIPMPDMVSIQSGELYFPVTRSEYTGAYYCVIGNGFDFMQQKLVHLYVLAPPLATAMPRSQLVNSGDVFRMSCMAEGTVPIEYEWYKVNGQLSPSAHDVDGMLEITKTTAADAGEYMCVARNEAGRSEAYATVSVQVPPQVTISPSNHTRSVGASVEFNCMATGSPPPRITWAKESGALPESHIIQNGILTLSNLQAGDDGVYICTATNRAGSRKGYARLTLQAPPDVAITVNAGYQFVAIGESVHFECRARGDPLPVISWSKQDGELPLTVQIEGGHLTIPNVQGKDSGLYRCTATNSVGSRSSEVLLFVQAAPKISVQPETASVSLGATVVFTCFATGFPIPEIVWYKAGSELFPEDFELNHGVLTLRNVKKADAGTYVCSATNDEGTEEYRANLVVGDLVPYFMQMPFSYIRYPKLDNADFSFTIFISFKPESPEGLILYNGESAEGRGDFVAFGLSEGHAEFRFDLGGGAAVIRSPEPLELGVWHSVLLRRDMDHGFLQVGDQPEVNGTSLGGWTGLNLVESLYLGGVASYENLPLSTGFSEGFIGCVSQLVINDYKVFLTSGAISMVNIDPCETCLSVSCQNGGECLEAFTESGFSCRCPEGYSGTLCGEVVSENGACPPGYCGEGMCIGNLGSANFYCQCPPGLTGERCEIDLFDDEEYSAEGSGEPDFHMQNDYGSPIFDPSFVGDSYIAFEGLLKSQHAVSISVMFKPNLEDDGLILFNGQRPRGTGDYVALLIRDERVVFQYDSGSGPAVIISEEAIKTGKWYTVSAERSGREGSLVVNEGVAVKGESPGTSRGLNLQLPLYLGGVEDFRDIPRALGVQKGFVGCITEVEIDDEPLDLVRAAIGHTNIQQCEELNPCNRMPCDNGGSCLNLYDSQYKCMCTEEFTGIHCETLIGPCRSEEPLCNNGGSCLPLSGDAYQCMCPLGFAGPSCDKNVTLEDGAFFGGMGYLTLPNMTIPRGVGTSDDKEVISFNFRTTDTYGVLLFQGAREGEDGSRQDYIAVSLTEGYLLFSYNLGSGEAEILSRSRVNNGQVHHVTVSRTKREGMMSIDGGTEIEGQSQGNLQMLNVQGNFYLGGTPDIEVLTGGNFIEGAEVCISDLTVQLGAKEPVTISFKDSAVGGVNVGDCTN